MEKSELEIQQEILRCIAKKFPNKVRLWRNNVGKGYGLGVVNKAISLLIKGDWRGALQVLQQSRPISFGVEGSPDLQGFVMIGGRPVYLGIEVKDHKGKQREAQLAWMKFIKSFNGYYFVCRSVDEFIMNVDNIQ